MSFNNIKTRMKSERGFTIVELLIVIVVIGILAAITIVAYNGVTARANTTAAKLAANSVLKKSEAYNAENNTYPAYPSQLTAAATTTSYYLAGVLFGVGTAGTAPNLTPAPTTVPATSSTLNFYSCGTGVQVAYWDYTALAYVNLTTGTCTTPVFKSTAANA